MLQFLLLFRVAVPALHTLMHGVNEPVLGTSAETSLFCSIAKATTEKKDTNKAIQTSQLSLADMLPPQTITPDFHLLVTSASIIYPLVDDKLFSRYLSFSTPPPQI